MALHPRGRNALKSVSQRRKHIIDIRSPSARIGDSSVVRGALSRRPGVKHLLWRRITWAIRTGDNLIQTKMRALCVTASRKAKYRWNQTPLRVRGCPLSLNYGRLPDLVHCVPPLRFGKFRLSFATGCPSGSAFHPYQPPMRQSLLRTADARVVWQSPVVERQRIHAPGGVSSSIGTSPSSIPSNTRLAS